MRILDWLSRVPHASEVLTGRFLEPPEFDPSDHRASRKAEWMTDALAKAAKVKFLAGEDTGRSMSQAAIKFVLAQPTIVTVLPNFTNMDELNEYTSACDAPDLTDAENTMMDDLWKNGFDLEDPVPQFREI